MKKKIEIKVKNIKVNPEDVFESKVIPSGNGAVISFHKKFIGRLVYIVLRGDKK